MAELHAIGTLLGASGFPSSALCCRWQFVAGAEWRLLEGSGQGQTHVDSPAEDPRYTVWDHPLDVHYSTKSIVGWPKLSFQVYAQDAFGRHELYGYASVHVPTNPGTYRLDCPVWRPAATTWREKLYAHFLQSPPTLVNPTLAHSPADRFRLRTETMGTVFVEITVVARGFGEFGVGWGVQDVPVKFGAATRREESPLAV